MIIKLRRARIILSSYLLSIFLSNPLAYGMEVDLVVIESKETVISKVVKRIGSNLEMNKKFTIKSLLKEISSKIFDAKGSIGKRNLKHPINLNLTISGRPDLTAKQSFIEPELIMTASKELSKGELELNLKSKTDTSNTVLVMYRFAF